MEMSSSTTITNQVVDTLEQIPTSSSNTREMNATTSKEHDCVDDELAEDDDNREEEFVFEINEDMIDFFTQSAKHKLELRELKPVIVYTYT